MLCYYCICRIYTHVYMFVYIITYVYVFFSSFFYLHTHGLCVFFVVLFTRCSVIRMDIFSCFSLHSVESLLNFFLFKTKSISVFYLSCSFSISILVPRIYPFHVVSIPYLMRVYFEFYFQLNIFTCVCVSVFIYVYCGICAT